MKVLLVEDDNEIASFVKKVLEKQGYVVDVCAYCDEGYYFATE